MSNFQDHNTSKNRALSKELGCDKNQVERDFVGLGRDGGVGEDILASEMITLKCGDTTLLLGRGSPSEVESTRELQFERIVQTENPHLPQGELQAKDCPSGELKDGECGAIGDGSDVGG